MLQPAPTTAVKHHAVATYGLLLTAARDRLLDAIAFTEQPMEVEVAFNHLMGYERFVRTAGHHLAQLMELTSLPAPQVHRLIRRLTTLKARETPPTPWEGAAKALGAAHDLVASHLHGVQPRTAEAAVLTGDATSQAAADVTALITEAHTGSQRLIQRYLQARPRGTEQLSTQHALTRVRSMNDDIDLFGKAAMWELSRETGAGSSLDQLQIAATPKILAGPQTAFERSLAALRLLSELSFQQAHGRATASPASLRDLALLGAKLTEPGRTPVIEGDHGLARVRAAHARDQLEAAHAHWIAASDGLTATIRGITKAPGDYRQAVDILMREHEATPRIRLAAVSALPRLGAEAAMTITALSSDGSLLTRQQDFCRPRKVWRVITPGETAELSARFDAAARHSRGAVAALREAPNQASGGEAQPVRRPERARYATRGIAR